MDGILPVYKPVGISSFDVIRAFKKANHPSFKIGHGGTLDPFADGILLLLLGKATKKMNELSELPKTYIATARLGVRSDTLDRMGSISKQLTAYNLQREKIDEVIKNFIGEIEQEIPDYSATKINGVPRYRLARSGIEMERKTKRVTIYDLRLMSYEDDLVKFEASVSSGTYIRQLSYDIFKSLGIESYLENLSRTTIGDYHMENCAKIEDFSQAKWIDKVLPLQPLARDESISPL